MAEAQCAQHRHGKNTAKTKKTQSALLWGGGVGGVNITDIADAAAAAVAMLASDATTRNAVQGYRWGKDSAKKNKYA
jgi:hypothetical protein